MDIDYTELKRLASAAQSDRGDYVALNEYGMAMPPAVCLALIAENEQIKRNRDMWKGQVERQAEELTDLRQDAGRYRWLTDDHESLHQREARNEICNRLPVMSYSAATTAIDGAIAEGTQP